MDLKEMIANCGYCHGKGCGVCNVWRIEQLEAELEYIGDLTGIAGVDKPMTVTECVAALKVENERFRRVLKEIYEGPHHSAIDATKCPDLVEWTYRVIDSAGDALKESE